MSNSHKDKLRDDQSERLTPREAGICVFWLGIAVLITLLVGVGVVGAILGGGE